MQDPVSQPDGDARVTPNVKTTPVRVKVEGTTGIYRRATKDGTVVHEIAYLDHGKQKWETVHGGLREAKRRRAEKMAKRPDERRAPSRETFGDVADPWYERKLPMLRESTARAYRDALDLVLLPRFGRTRLALIGPDEIVKLRRDLEREGLHAVDPSRPVRPLGRSSVKAYEKPLAGVLAHAARRGLVSVNPFTLLTKEDRPVRGEERPMHQWQSAEITALVAASRGLAVTPESAMDWTPLLRVAVTLGLRIGEITGLQWRDLWKNERGDYVLRVERQWLSTGRYGPVKTAAANREIAVPSDLAGDLLALKLRSRYSADECPIFAGEAGAPLAHRTVTRHGWAPARDAAGLPSSLTFHSTRHACASRLIDAGLDPVTCASVLGHEDAHVTLKIYAARFDRQKKDDLVRAALAGVAE